ncbi:LRR receptor-like serine/threonine-protein kinase GSO1 [Glycine soja]|uniref:LRR receptor-like serine/threonine-protein kinase GSO1 n=1 Tax=Glycine soja TaxID=3848 RepID=A0A0B2S7T0_GLYSO|nr:LRR receptor-like serine/threonine-protein kinase GSO1 [Glycine soja]
MNILCLVLILSLYGFNGSSKSAEAKCVERERQTLLNFKQGLIDASGMLSSWRDDDNNKDCCKWKGIECNNKTGHIDMLDLRGSEKHYLTGAINLTSLIDLQNMEHLDLSSNYDSSEMQIPEHIGSFKNLRYLNLSYIGLSGRIPYELGNLSKLEYLDLKANFLDGAIPSQLGNLTTLRYLDLSYNSEIEGQIPYQFRNLSQLQYLDLEGTYLSGAIPFKIGNLPILHTLMLGQDLDVKSMDTAWLSSLYSLTHLGLDSINNLGSSQHLLLTISKFFPNLRELSLNLEELYLSHNNIVFSSPFHPYFPSLVILDLSYNNMASLVFQVNSSSSLDTLHLSFNLLKSSVIFHWLFNFTNLRRLHLVANLLEGSIPDGFGKIMNYLEDLVISSNRLQGEIPASLGNICTLQRLYLKKNNLSGEISSLIKKFSWCNKTGMLPNLSNLDLSFNRLTGEIPKSIGLLYELESLHLEENYLEGDIIESHLTNLTKLEELDLTGNLLSLKFGNTWVPSFQLYVLGLASCKLGPSFPSWIQTQSHLQFLDISDAGIDDFVPDWFWNKLQSIYAMNMSYNNLKGTIPNLPIKLTMNYEISVFLNSNQLEGEIPTFLSQVSILDLSENKISDLNAFFCGKGATANMLILDLSSNQIMGKLPDCWEHHNSLKVLDLSNNRLSGKIPESMDTLVNLKSLVLRNNSLIGELPLTLKNCTSLVTFDVSENLLSGPIPSWIGESLQQLKILSLRVNRFFGSVPVHLCYLRQIRLLDLSRNNLSEGIPTCLSNFTAMRERTVIRRKIVTGQRWTYGVISSDVYDSNVLLMWKGQEYLYLNPEFLLKSIDLSSNDLTGEIPKEVRYLLELVSLNLSRNRLSGEILPEIGNLTSLEFLDLSRNHLSGEVPSTLSKIDRLAVLDLSNNYLVGRIPWGRQLQTFSASTFEGNTDLCGEPLNKSCPGNGTATKPQGPAIQGHDDNSVFCEALYMSLGLGFFTGFWGLIEGPEPSDAPMAPQGAVEAVEEGESDDEEANADDCVNERCSGIFNNKKAMLKSMSKVVKA